MRKEVWFGLTIMAAVVIGVFAFMPPPAQMTNGHLGLLMLALIVVAIMLGFPTAFTLMGMGVIFSWFAYRSQNPELAVTQTLDLMVQRAYAVMSNDVLISIPLFVFMGYLVERANLIEKLFRSLHLALARIPGSLAVATLVTCAVFATATGIVGAVVTLMGLLAMPPMLRAGYNIRLVAGVITAGGCLGILIPPSVMLIVYGATAGVSVVQLYAGAFFPGLMLAGLYIGYVIIVAKLRPDLAPPLPRNERHVPLPPHAKRIADTISPHAIPGLFAGMRRLTGGDRVRARRDVLLIASPALLFVLVMGLTWNSLTKPDVVADVAGLEQVGVGATEPPAETSAEGSRAGQLAEPAQEGRLAEPGQLAEPPADGRLPEPGQLAEPQADGRLPEPGQLAEAEADGRLPEPGQAGKAAVAEGPAASSAAGPPPAGEAMTSGAATATAAPSAGAGAWERLPAPNAFWITLAAGIAVLAALYWSFTLERVEIFRQLVSSFFPLAVMILAVLGTIVFGLATPTEAAAIGSLGGFALAAVYGLVALPPERRRKVALAWIPLLLLVGVSIAWFILYKAEVLEAGPPLVIGWISIAAAFLWVATATWQARLGQTVRESVFLTAKTSAMVCWLFVGSSIFSAAFALLGGQEIVERWVLSLGLTPIQFMILAQVIIFLLGWPLEWTEIIVIFMPIFVPLLIKFQIDPLFFGLLVALNLQTAFLSPPVAMAAFYLKGVAPPHVTLNQIFLGMLPFMAIQLVALALLYVFPGIGLWLPQVLYR